MQENSKLESPARILCGSQSGSRTIKGTEPLGPGWRGAVGSDVVHVSTRPWGQTTWLQVSALPLAALRTWAGSLASLGLASPTVR